MTVLWGNIPNEYLFSLAYDSTFTGCQWAKHGYNIVPSPHGGPLINDVWHGTGSFFDEEYGHTDGDLVRSRDGTYVYFKHTNKINL